MINRTGLPKGVLGTQMASLAAAFQSLNSVIRAGLRDGQTLEAILTPKPGTPEQKASLVSIPLFHTSGTQSALLSGTLVGAKVVLMWKWDLEKGEV